MFYSDTTCRYHFCRPWRCNANGESILRAFWYYETIRMLFVDVEVDEYFIILCCYRDVGVSLLFISYFPWNFWTNQTWENEYSKTISAKHWKLFFALFSMAQPNSLKAFSLLEMIFPWNYFTLGNSFTWSQTQPKFLFLKSNIIQNVHDSHHFKF